jgi:hypothetical protein
MGTGKSIVITPRELRDADNLRIHLREIGKHLVKCRSLIQHTLELVNKVGGGNLEGPEGTNIVAEDIYEFRAGCDHNVKLCGRMDQKLGEVLNKQKEGKLYVVTKTVRSVAVGNTENRPVRKSRAGHHASTKADEKASG